MKKKLLLFPLASLLAASGSFGATTDPVGAMTVQVANNADSVIGVPFEKSPDFSAVVGGVDGGVVSFSGSISPDSFGASHYLKVTSGALEGHWFEVTSNSSSSVSVQEDVESAGLAIGDNFSLIPFWTLSSLFPANSGFPSSSDLTAPVARLYLNNLSTVGTNLSPEFVFILHSGEQLPAGWYSDSTYDSADGVRISPETYIAIRNRSGNQVDIVFVGSVPVTTRGSSVGRLGNQSQDNRIANPFPVNVRLDQLNLESVVEASPDLTAPADRLYVFDSGSTVINPSPTKVYIYHSGEQLSAGWYEDSVYTSADDAVIPAGAAMIIRKGEGVAGLSMWIPPIPYNL